MEKKKNSIVSYLLIILFFVVICYMVYCVVASRYSNNNSLNDSDKVIISHKLRKNLTSTVNKYLLDIFDVHSNKYCGKLDYDDTYSSGLNVYSKNNSFTSISEIKEQYSTIISEKYFNNVLRDKFVEHDGKLYCLTSTRSSLDYESESVKVTGITVDGDNLIVKGNYRTLESDLYSSELFNFEIIMIKYSNNWVIDSYEEK